MSDLILDLEQIMDLRSQVRAQSETVSLQSPGRASRSVNATVQVDTIMEGASGIT